MDKEKISTEKMIQALNYVGEYLNNLSVAGYENRKAANACVDNIVAIINQLKAEDKDGME